MHNLARMYAVQELLSDSSSLYEAGFFKLGTAPIMLEAAKKLMTILRPAMIPLVEAWGIADSMLVSAIGN